MDHQGAGGARHPADARRRQPWRPSGSPQPQYGESQPYDEPADSAEHEYGSPTGTGSWTSYGPRRGSGPMPAAAPGAARTGAYHPGTGAYATGTGATGTGATGTGATGTGAYAAGPRPGSGPQPSLGPGSGPQPAAGAQGGFGPGSGAQPALGQGSGTQPVLGPGSGPQRALDRNAARGFPPRGAQQEHAADSWYNPVGGYSPAADSYPPPSADSYPPPPPAGYAPTPEPGAGYAPPPEYDYSSPPPAPGEPQYGYASDDGPMAAEPGPDRTAKPGRRRRPVVIALVTVLVLAGLGAVGYKLVYEPRHATAAAENALKLPSTNATASNPYVSNGVVQWHHIDTRKLDRAPLTLAELYPPAFTLTGSEYLKATGSLTKTCGNAVYGDLIQAALQSGDCTQVARASYVSGDGQIMGTIGVANLSSAYQAQKAVKTASSTELVAPLTTGKGPTKNLLKGTGVAYAEVKGHYLILLYAEFTSTKTPKTAAQKQELVAFCEGMFSGSADIPLSHRMVYGKP